MAQLLIHLVNAGGLLAILVLMTAESAGLPISSEIVVPLGGALASGAIAGSAHLSFWGVVAAATVGNLVGSLVAYALTRRYGAQVILGPGRHVGLDHGHLALAERFFDRFGLAAVFFGRLLPVVRTYISFPAGLSRRITPGRFTVFTLAGALPWNLGLAFAGLKLGDNWSNVEKALGPLTIPAAIVVVAVVVVVYFAGKRVLEREAG